MVMAAAATSLAAVAALGGQAAPSAPAGGVPPVRVAEAAGLRARGQGLGYNLDRDAALASFREAMAVDPSHPAAYRLTAATLWIGALFERGAVTAEDYLGQARSEVERRPPYGRAEQESGGARGDVPLASRSRGAAGRGAVPGVEQC